MLDSLAIGADAAVVARVNAPPDSVIVHFPVIWHFTLSFGMGFPGIYYGQEFSLMLPAIAGLFYFGSKKIENEIAAGGIYSKQCIIDGCGEGTEGVGSHGIVAVSADSLDCRY